jgi:SAM-dependent methyltransferase
MAVKHFFEQKEFTKSYLIPYFRKHIPDFNNLKVLEVGCAEGGFLDVLYELGIDAAGLELQAQRVQSGKTENPHLNMFVGDITEKNYNKITEQVGKSFDLIVMRDVIEHVPNRSAMFSNIYQLLKPDGYLYVTFPPKYSGFAGHQQNGKSPLRYMPYLHLLPNKMIRLLGKWLAEKPNIIEGVIVNYETGLSIKVFEDFLVKYNFTPVVKELFLFRPVYKVRFNVPPVKIPNIPVLREVIAFGCEYLMTRK